MRTTVAVFLSLGLAGCASDAQWFRLGGTQSRSGAGPVIERFEQGGKVYNSSECIGPVIMGRCEGTILPKKAYHPTCHGSWLNGRCIGPMF